MDEAGDSAPWDEDAAEQQAPAGQREPDDDEPGSARSSDSAADMLGRLSHLTGGGSPTRPITPSSVSVNADEVSCDVSAGRIEPHQLTRGTVPTRCATVQV